MIAPSVTAAQQIVSPVTSGGTAGPLQTLAADLDSWISAVLGGGTSSAGTASQDPFSATSTTSVGTASAGTAAHHHHHHATQSTTITNGGASAAGGTLADVSRALQAYGANS